MSLRREFPGEQSDARDALRRKARNAVVHLELRSPNLARACDFFEKLVGWRVETVHVSGGTYVALQLSHSIEGGVVERDDPQAASWIPYVEVAHIVHATRRAQELGATVLLAPREGPVGWRAEVIHPAAGVVAFWQRK